MRTVDIRRDRDELRVLMVPGLGGSGPRHWQSVWQEIHPEYERVVQRDWTKADLRQWADAVSDAIEAHSGPVLLAAHDFGCLAAVHAARDIASKIYGTLLVAPADPARWGFEKELLGARLHRDWILLASHDDSVMRFERARGWADRWSCRFIDVDNAGHLNAGSGHGAWPAGHWLLAQLRADLQASRAPVEAALAA